MIIALEPHQLVDPTRLDEDLDYVFPPGATRTSLLDDRLNDRIVARLAEMKFNDQQDAVLLAGPVPGILRLAILVARVYSTRTIRFYIHDASINRYRQIKVF